MQPGSGRLSETPEAPNNGLLGPNTKRHGPEALRPPDDEALGSLAPNTERRGLQPLCVLRGGGDLATGVAWEFVGRRWPVVVLELPEPLAVRRTVALSTAVTEGEIRVEGMRGVRAESPEEALDAARRGDVGVLVAPSLAVAGLPRPHVMVDARLAKRNIDTSIDDAEVVVALGPGFAAGVDCHAVVETMRGPSLGRVIWSGYARPDTGIPGELGGRSADRVVRSPADGIVEWRIAIGDVVAGGQRLGEVAGVAVTAPFDGVVRGAIRSGMKVRTGLKIGDVDPRGDPSACWSISDKALAVGQGALEAVLARLGGL